MRIHQTVADIALLLITGTLLVSQVFDMSAEGYGRMVLVSLAVVSSVQGWRRALRAYERWPRQTLLILTTALVTTGTIFSALNIERVRLYDLAVSNISPYNSRFFLISRIQDACITLAIWLAASLALALTIAAVQSGFKCLNRRRSA